MATTATYIRLQDPISVSASTKQDRRDAADVSTANTIVIQINRVIAGGANFKLQFEHAAVLMEGAFEPLGSQIALDATGPITVSFTTHSRYERWTAVSTTGSANFFIDIVARG